MMKKKKRLDVVFILDKSGSMAGIEEHTISSFNEYLEKEKKNSFDTPLYIYNYNFCCEIVKWFWISHCIFLPFLL